MTPSAKSWMKYIASGKPFNDQAKASKRILEAKQFDCSEIAPMALDLAVDHMCDDTDERKERQLLSHIFLPHNPCWIEYAPSESIQNGGAFLLIEGTAIYDGVEQRALHILRMASGHPDGAGLYHFAAIHLDMDVSKLHGSDRIMVSHSGWPIKGLSIREDDYIYAAALHIAIMLSIINTPKMFKVVENKSSRFFHEKLRKSKRLMQDRPYQLLPWSVIKIEMFIDNTSSTRGSIKGHERCLHYCRAHLRFWNGRLIHVKGHYRGNAAKGIKRSTYTVGGGFSLNHETLLTVQRQLR